METKSNNLTADIKTTSPVELSKDEFHQLLTFFATGVNENKDLIGLKDKKLVPIHYKYWEDNDIIPNPFPLCFIENYPDKIAISLDVFFSQLKKECDEQNSENSEKVFKDLKKHIKSHLNGFSQEYLNKIWDQSTQSLLKTYQESDDTGQKTILEKVLNIAKKKLNIQGEIVALSEQTPLKYLNLAIDRVWQKKSNAFVEELDWLILRLNGFLQADYLKTKEGKAPENLRESVGETFEEDLDFSALSTILENAIEEDTLTPIRQKRIRNVVKCLENFRNYYPGFVNHKKTIPLQFEPKNNDIKKIKEQLKKYRSQVLEFYKSVHIARLEVTNQYSEKKHDAFFEDFHFSFLSPEDVVSIPPFPVYLSSRDIENSSFEALTELMELNLPVKLLFVVDDVINFKNTDNHVVQTNKWSRKLASMAINLANAFILKSTVLNLSGSEKELLAGLNYDGPALFCIFRHNEENFKNQDDATPYHALVNSRAFPLWTFTPTGKHEIAPQFNVTANPSPKKHWSDEIIQDTPFTIIDFLASYKRLSQHFLVLPEEKSHINLIPFHEYQHLDDLIAKDKLPYTLMVNKEGKVFKVLPDYAIIKATDNFIGNWRTLQELSNVHNMKDAETAEEIKEETVLQQEAPKSTDEISREIVSNILSRLISGDLEPRPVEATGPIGEVKEESESDNIEETKEVEQTAQEEIEPEPEINTDEPYIESALCTSCNDCININSMMFAYNEDKQAYIKDVTKGTFKHLVMAAEKCPAAIIHPGKPKDPNEKDLDKLIKRAEKFN